MFVKSNWIWATFLFLDGIILTSCEKFLAVKAPIQYSTQPTELETDSDASAAVVGIYEQLSGNIFGPAAGQWGISNICGLSADELRGYGSTMDLMEYFLNDISATNSINRGLWSTLYKSIYQCNSVLESLRNNKNITAPINAQLQGEALFFRAYLYFYLVNLYGAVPLAISTNYKINDTLTRAPVSEVYDLIKSDLVLATSLLSDNYVGNGERIRVNKGAALALFSRISLYMGDYRQCIAQATSVLSHPDQYQLCADPNQTYLKNSKETILQLKPVLPSYNTADAEIFILPRNPMIVSLQDAFVSIFDTVDTRKMEWVGTYANGSNSYFYPFKYKRRKEEGVTEYLMMLRLAEVYLNRAEAYAQLGFTDSGARDLNMIRARANLPGTSAANSKDLLQMIYTERRKELFTEWGLRWLDLKRTGAIDSVLGVVKGGSWRSAAQLFPIPANEITLNPRLDQNAGY